MERLVVPFTLHTHIAAPREEVYDLVSDLAARVAWTDHYVDEYRLTRPRSSGPGAAARFRVGNQWAETVIADGDRPRLLREEGRMGRLGRTRTFTEWSFEEPSRGNTRVEMTYWTQPAGRFAALREGRLRRHLRRKCKVALERLRRVFEEERERPLARARIAAWEPAKAPRFGSFVQVPTSRIDPRG
jgi:hypothetical protein